MDGIRGWIEAEGTGHWFFIAFPVVLICLLIWFKGRRVRFLIPSLLISIVIINPWFYRAWDSLGLYAYWRILWAIPVIPIVAGLIPSITERIQKGWIKAVVAVVGVGAVMVGGTFLYNGAGGSFVEAANAAKLPDYVVQIADRLLELDEHPRVVAQNPLSIYIRQYSGEIDTLFGRDVAGGYIKWPSGDALRMDNVLNNPESDLDTIRLYMLDEGYDYLIMNSLRDVDNLFDLVDSVGDYGIYRAIGVPTQMRVQNELGQVTAITTLDEYGNPTNNSYGYSTIHRDYDLINNIIKEWYTDVDGILCVQLAGHMMIAQTWNGFGQLASRSYLNAEGEAIERCDGYTKAIWETDSLGTVNIKLFDLQGREIDKSGINLVKDVKIGADGWSEWITPERDSVNCCFTIGTFNLGEKKDGDVFTCQIEIEFKDVSATEGHILRFWTQGSADNKWDIGNPWNHVVNLSEVPRDGRYSFIVSNRINEDMAKASTFELGFRCDYWSSGMFRVRNVKVEYGETASEWSPGV